MVDPIQPAYREQMNDVAARPDGFFNGSATDKPKVGFTLLIFEFGQADNGRVNYISNAERSDMLTAMKEFIARAEGRLHEPKGKQ